MIYLGISTPGAFINIQKTPGRRTHTVLTTRKKLANITLKDLIAVTFVNMKPKLANKLLLSLKERANYHNTSSHRQRAMPPYLY